jgi:hypothetical protein
MVAHIVQDCSYQPLNLGKLKNIIWGGVVLLFSLVDDYRRFG